MVRQRAGTAHTQVNFSGYAELERDINEGLVDTRDHWTNPYHKALKRIAELYREFLKRRYNQYKVPIGGWPSITKSTYRWRVWRHGIKHRQVLYVTRTLYKLTDKKYSPAKGHLERKTKYGISVGVAAGKRHPDFSGTVRRLVNFHARGRTTVPGMPARKIFVPVDQATKAKMHNVMVAAHKKAVKKANKKVKTRRST